jgi:hypothetical protein
MIMSAIDQSPNKPAPMTSLQSLVDARNDFSHGGSPTTSIGDVITYYLQSRSVIEMLDAGVV